MSSEETGTVPPRTSAASGQAAPDAAATAGPRPPLTRADVQRVVGRLAGPGREAAPPAVRPRAPAPAPAEVVREVRQRFAAWRGRRLGLRGALLYVLPLPLPIAGLVALASGDFGAAVSAIGAFAALFAGARLNRRALREQVLAPQRRYSRPSAMPYGYLAGGLVAAGTAIAAAGVIGHGALVSAAFAALAAAGFQLSYPLAPLRSLLRRPEREPADARVRAALQVAESRVLAIELAAEGIGNRELEDRLRRIASQGRGILELIGERPGELSRARKFLNVYLEGAERVASRYVKTHRLSRSRELEGNFRNVLAEIESVFERQRTLLLEHDVDDLDIQIEVLRKQLEREGIN